MGLSFPLFCHAYFLASQSLSSGRCGTCRRAVALQRRRPGDRAREHRGSLRRPRARGRARRRREPEDHHREGVDAHRAVRVRARAAARPQEGDGDPQSEHHEAERRPVPRVRAQRRRASYPDIEYDERIVDAACMQLVMNPEQFDVLRAAEPVRRHRVGSVRRPGRRSRRGRRGEPRRPRSACSRRCTAARPDIAGKNLANPTALLLSAVLMLRHIDEGAGGRPHHDGARRGADRRRTCARAISAARRRRTIGVRRRDLPATLKPIGLCIADAIVRRRFHAGRHRPGRPRARGSRQYLAAATATSGSDGARADLRAISTSCARRSGTILSRAAASALSDPPQDRAQAREPAPRRRGGHARDRDRLRLEPPEPHRLSRRAAGARRQRHPAAADRRGHQPVRRPARADPPARHRRHSDPPQHQGSRRI